LVLLGTEALLASVGQLCDPHRVIIVVVVVHVKKLLCESCVERGHQHLGYSSFGLECFLTDAGKDVVLGYALLHVVVGPLAGALEIHLSAVEESHLVNPS